MYVICRLHKLEFLGLSEVGLKAEALIPLGNLVNLEKVELDGRALDIQLVPILARLKKLKWLFLACSEHPTKSTPLPPSSQITSFSRCLAENFYQFVSGT